MTTSVTPPPSPTRAYLDHAATTPMLPEAIDVLTAHLGRLGNPSSLHASGRAVRRVLEESREQVAGALGARPSEVVFTAGGTEADNLAVKGIYWARRAADPRRTRLVVSSVEHHAVLDAVQWLAEFAGAGVDWLPVDASGRVVAGALEEILARSADEVALVSVMMANNEVGTVQPISDVARIARTYDIPVHTDAVQAVGQLPVDFGALGVDAMTVSGHKVGGPTGVGALVLRRELKVTPILHGGGQERDVRSGTFNTPAIASFAMAIDRAVAEREPRAKAVGGLRDKLIDLVLAAVPDAELNGDPELAPDRRLPGIAHFAFPGCEGDSLLLLLDAQGIECSTGSACSAGVAEPSHVLLAMGRDEQRARGSLRFSLGHTSTEAEIEALGSAIGGVVERARTAGLVNVGRSGMVPSSTEDGKS